VGAQLGVGRRRRLQIDRRRRELDPPRPPRFRAHRAHPRRSQGARHRLRLRHGAPVERQRGARRLQDHGRRQELEEGAHVDADTAVPTSRSTRRNHPLRRHGLRASRLPRARGSGLTSTDGGELEAARGGLPKGEPAASCRGTPSRAATVTRWSSQGPGQDGRPPRSGARTPPAPPGK
jgi:hypothetical protein